MPTHLSMSEPLSIVLSHYQNGGNVAQLVSSLNQAIDNIGPQAAVNLAISVAQITDSLVSSMGSSLPLVINTADGAIPLAGVALSTLSLANNVGQILDNISTGSVPDANIIGAIADAAGAVGSLALALAAVAAGTVGAVPAMIAVGVTLSVVSIALTVASVAVGDARSEVPAPIMDLVNAIEDMTSAFGTALDEARAGLTDVIEDAANTLSDLDAALDDWLNEAVSVGDGIAQAINDFFVTGARTRPPVPRDPLAIDLDGDGIETSGAASNPVLFDHNADGIRTGSGWVRSDDAWLVLDRNGNGLIDSGRELFGVDTVLSGTPGVDAVYAATGFQALRTLDANADNVFNAQDAAFADVRLWRDLNQDGISQAGELFTLAQYNIASISLNATSTNINLGNGNTVSGTATVTRSNGSTTQAGSVSVAADTTAANLDLATNPFYREFTTPVTLTAAAEALPDMSGSGWVRDLREAMSLGTAQADALAAKVQEFAAATTAQAQRALLDDLLRLWAETNQTQAVPAADDPLRRFVVAGDTVTSARLQWALPILEVFNGLVVDDAGMQAPVLSTNGQGQTVRTYNMFGNQAPVMLSAYDALKESVYGSLVLQTRLQPYLDAIDLVIDENGLHFDTTAAQGLVQTKASADAYNAVADLLDLKRYADNTLDAVGWEPYKTLSDVLQTTTLTAEIQALLATERIVALGAAVANHTVTDGSGRTVVGNAMGNTLSGGAGSDALYGLGGNDSLNGGAGNNVLDGGEGDDVLSGGGSYNGWSSDTLLGGAGNDILNAQFSYSTSNVLDGGAGNDTLNGSYYNDTYRFGLGGGQDTLNEGSSSGGSSYADKLVFGAGIAAADISVQRAGNHLVFRHANGVDQVTVNNWFANTSGSYQLETVEFADGTTWSAASLTAAALVVSGTEGADTLSGTVLGDTLLGLGGNDSLNGGAGNNVLDGGEGDDVLSGGGSYNGWSSDTLLGGAGNDILNAQFSYSTSNVLDGGAGNDTLNGSYYNDTYRFGLGGGQDTLNEGSSSGGSSYADKLMFGAGIAEDQLWFARSGNALVVSVIGTGDQVTINNWYTGSTYRIEELRVSDGSTLSSSSVQALVDAMAAFSPPAAGQTTLPSDYQSSLSPVIASSWTPSGP